MAVRSVPINEETKDHRKWIYEVRYNGKRIKSKKYLTKKEAEFAEREFYNQKKKDGNQSLMTLGDLFASHNEYQKDKVKLTTFNNYKKKLKHFDSLKGIVLGELNIHDIEKWKQEMNSKNLAVRTKNDLMKYLKSALNFGTKWYDFNFTSLYNKMTNFTNPNELPKEMDFYTYDEFKKFISVVDDLKFKCMFETLYYCGLRRGELLGLSWDNINFEDKTLSVVKNVVNEKGRSGYWEITTPKTKTSKRILPLPKQLYNDLNKLMLKSKQYYGFDKSWFVFGDIKPMSTDMIRRYKTYYAKKAGLRVIRTHDFRHSCASLLINKGASVIMVAKYLGHSKIDETLNTYSHMFKNQLDEIVKTIDDLE